MLELLRKRWFLASLLVLIPLGLTIGSRLSPDDIAALKSVIRPRLVTAAVLFLMAFSLDSRHLQAAFASPGPVLWSTSVNYGLIPLLGLALMPWQGAPDFQYGLMIAASVPCTMAAASVWTRKAGGNDAVSLLVTVATNGLCFLITPFWLNLATGSGIELDTGAMVWRLVSAVLLPAAVGQAVRLWPAAARFATNYKTPLGVAAQACILTIVFSASCEAGTRLNGSDGSPTVPAVVGVWGTCILIHLTAMAVGITGGRLLGFSRPDRVAAAFASSQKTLPIGVLLATDPSMFGNPDLLGTGGAIPFAVFPMLMYHASQLFIDTVVADRLREAGEREQVAESNTV